MYRIYRRILSASIIILLLADINGFYSYASVPVKRPDANTELRHVDCTSLSDQAKAYYSGQYSYESMIRLRGAADISTSYKAMQENELFDMLHKLMTESQTFYVSYAGYRKGSLAYYWQRTDSVKNADDFISFYSDIIYDYKSAEDKNYNMEREHIWPTT